jgi:hypothetical protein
MVHRSSPLTSHTLLIGLAALTPTLTPAPALAQEQPAASAAGSAAAGPAPAGGQLSSVRVVGERQNNRIDRQVYDVKGDVASSNGTAADALNNVPSVSVDPDGTVSLRGSSNLQ